MKILLLEDDVLFCDALKMLLEREGYLVDIASFIKDAEDLTFDNNYDLYIFDINLPEGSGLDFLKSLRYAQDNTPIIFITAQVDINSITDGFELGAIDYIKKPFEPNELLVRLKARFRDDIIYYKDIEFNPKAQTITKNKELIDLGIVNYKIASLLLSRCGEVVLKEELYECFDKSSSRALRVAISLIKQRLQIDIKNIRAKGYIIEAV